MADAVAKATLVLGEQDIEHRANTSGPPGRRAARSGGNQ
jgi:hypothetical protein